MSRLARVVVICCASMSLPFAAPACGSSDAGPAAGQGGKSGAGGANLGGGNTGGTGGSSQLTCSDNGSVDMTGTWAIFLRYSLSLQSQTGGAITMCPADQVSTSTMYLIVDIQQTGTDVQIQPIHCDMSLPVVTGIVGDCDPKAPNLVSVGIIPPARLISAIPDVAMQLAKGSLSSTTSGASLTMDDRFAFTTGTTKKGTEMPKWLDTNPGCGASDIEIGRDSTCASQCVSDCSVLTDDDHDGLPAVTFNVCGTTPDDVQQKVKCNADQPAEAGTTIQGRVELVYQTDPKITGTVKSSCEAIGTFSATTIYNVIGADLYLANTKISVASSLKSLPVYVIDPVKSQFRMIRVDGKYGAPSWGVDLTKHVDACTIAIQHQNELQ